MADSIFAPLADVIPGFTTDLSPLIPGGGTSSAAPNVDPRTTILGGENSLLDTDGGGVYTANPASQLKYYQDWRRSQETQARLYVSLPQSAKDLLKASARRSTNGSRTDALVDTLCGDTGYIDFILSSAQESNDERCQPVELLGEDYVAYFFGSRIPTYGYSGSLYTTLQDDWWDAFSILYKEVMRGTKLAQHQALVHLSYDSRVISGAMLNFSTSLSAESQMAVTFNFQLLVKQVSLVKPRRGGRADFKPTQVKETFGTADFDKQSFEQRLAIDTVGATVRTGQVQDARVVVPPEKPKDVSQEGQVADAAANASIEENKAIEALAYQVLKARERADMAAGLSTAIIYEGPMKPGEIVGNAKSPDYYTADQAKGVSATRQVAQTNPDGTVSYVAQTTVYTITDAKLAVYTWMKDNQGLAGFNRRVPRLDQVPLETPAEVQARLLREHQQGAVNAIESCGGP